MNFKWRLCEVAPSQYHYDENICTLVSISVMFSLDAHCP